MKKIFFAMMALIAMSISAFAESINVRYLAGHSVEGELVYRDDTLVRMIPYYYGKREEITVTPDRVQFFDISGTGRFYVQDGKFVPTAKTQERLAKNQEKKRVYQQEVQERVSRQLHNRAADPNAVIAHALKTTGEAAIGLGIPSLIVGTVLVAYGYADVSSSSAAGISTSPSTDEQIKRYARKSRCATAGCVLMPFGAALTVVGVPLHVHGKRIAEMKFNYTGNGAGISMNF